ncbi:MAG: hypothetical protein R3E08_02070 [Thiotrichaceae bacterium]
MPKELRSGTVARYCSQSRVVILDEKQQPDPTCFNLRQQRVERYLSVYLLEYFEKSSEKANLLEVKRVIENGGFKCKTGIFALLDIEGSKHKFEQKKLKISYQPLNLPHCGIFHDYDYEYHELYITELLVQCVKTCYSTKQLES